jgi:hypothetical protein
VSGLLSLEVEKANHSQLVSSFKNARGNHSIVAFSAVYIGFVDVLNQQLFCAQH